MMNTTVAMYIDFKQVEKEMAQKGRKRREHKTVSDDADADDNDEM